MTAGARCDRSGAAYLAGYLRPDVPNGGWLTSEQGSVVRRHCAVQPTGDAGGWAPTEAR